MLKQKELVKAIILWRIEVPYLKNSIVLSGGLFFPQVFVVLCVSKYAFAKPGMLIDDGTGHTFGFLRLKLTGFTKWNVEAT